MSSSPWARAAIGHVQTRSVGEPLDRSLRITLNFHPDAVLDGRLVLEALAADGTYRSQFETATSNGGLTAYPGGQRWSWEERIFGGVYREAPATVRPRYGALDHRRRGLGGAPRFGSAHLRLAEHVLDRATVCFPDSVLEPTHFGTVEAFDLIPLAEAFARVPRDDAAEREGGGVLDDYVEAHVHGPVRVDGDVEAVVLDPAHRETEVERAAARLGVPVEWHEGRVLTVEELGRHPGFRGPEAVAAGRAMAHDGLLDAAVLGVHRRAGLHDPQLLKQVWHLIARFGSPRAAMERCYPADRLVPYDVGWSVRYRRLAEQLGHALGADWHIEHVGSTSVPGLPAKPVVDLALRMPEGVGLVDAGDRLTGAGWTAPAPVGDHWATFLLRDRVREAIGHLYPATAWDDAAVRHFARWLREHPADRDRYAALKADLVARDVWGAGYTAAKAGFVDQIVTRARAWR